MSSNKESLVQQSQSIVNVLEARGISVPRGSRFERYRRLFESTADGAIGPEHKDFDAVRQGFVDVQLMRFIVDHLPDTPDTEWENRLVASLGGASIATTGKAKQSSARDTQFELYSACQLRKAGMYERFDERPDIHFRVNGSLWGMACKRLTSPRKLESAVKSARDQIMKSGIPGVIALELSTAFNQSCEAIGADISPNEADRKVITALSGIADAYREDLDKWIKATRVKGVRWHYHMGHSEASGRWALISPTLSIPLWEKNDRVAREFAEFTARADQGSPTPSQQAPYQVLKEREHAAAYFRKARSNKWKLPRK